MGLSMKDKFLMERDSAKEFTNGKMEQNMKVRFKTINFMGSE